MSPEDKDIADAAFAMVPLAEVELERGNFRMVQVRDLEAEDRERAIMDLSTTDEQFLGGHLGRYTFNAIYKDYEERLTLRALRLYCERVGAPTNALDDYKHMDKRDIVYATECASPDVPPEDREAMFASIYAGVVSDRFNICDRCGTPSRFGIDWHRLERVCDSCRSEWLQKPSTPPACGIRSALARARAKQLPATLTVAEWEATVEHFEDRCAYCGGPWCLIEHVTPIELGGGTVRWNCVPSCGRCNNKKRRGDLPSTQYFWDPIRIAKIEVWLVQLGRTPLKKRRKRKAKPL